MNGFPASYAIISLGFIAFVLSVIMYINMKGVDEEQNREIARHRDVAQNFREQYLSYRESTDAKIILLQRQLNDLDYRLRALEK